MRHTTATYLGSLGLSLTLGSPTLQVMIGLPGSGKSTLIKAINEKFPDVKFVIASTDDMIDAWALERGLTYSEAFEKAPMKEFGRQFKQIIKDAIENGDHLIVDRTNMGAKARREYFKHDVSKYIKFAVNVTIPDKVLKERLAARAASTGKFIPAFVMSSMAGRFEPPTKAEGFDQIIDLVNA